MHTPLTILHYVLGGHGRCHRPCCLRSQPLRCFLALCTAAHSVCNQSGAAGCSSWPQGTCTCIWDLWRFESPSPCPERACSRQGQVLQHLTWGLRAPCTMLSGSLTCQMHVRAAVMFTASCLTHVSPLPSCLHSQALILIFFSHYLIL